MSNICSVEGCNQPTKCRGLCCSHYDKMRRHGEAMPPRKVSVNYDEALTNRNKTVDECLVWTGHINNEGYGHIKAKGKVTRVHRLAWENVNGPVPEGMILDHICHNRACFNIDHLRLATAYDNQANRSGANKNSRTGVRNVTIKRGRYQVRVNYHGITHYGGVFADISAATTAAELLRSKLFGDFKGLS